MNEMERDRLIRETFDKTLSGIDALPSLQSDVMSRISETPSKRRTSFVTVLVTALLLLTLTVAIAEITGNNLFAWFGKDAPLMGKLAEKAETYAPTLQGEPQTAHIDSSYYDGESLIVTVAIPSESTLEAFSPDEDLKHRMARIDTVPENIPWENAEPELKETWDEALRNKTAMGLVKHTQILGDGQNTQTIISANDRVLLSRKNSMGQEEYSLQAHEAKYINRDVYNLLYIRYDEPLPDELRNLEEFDVSFRIRLLNTYYYYDGENCYWHSETEEMEPLSAHVVNNHEEIRYFTGQGTLQDIEMKIQAKTSGASVQITLQRAEETDSPARIFVPDFYSGFLLRAYDEKGQIVFNDYLFSNEYDMEKGYCITLPQEVFSGFELRPDELPSSLTVYLIQIPGTVGPDNSDTIKNADYPLENEPSVLLQLKN